MCPWTGSARRCGPWPAATAARRSSSATARDQVVLRIYRRNPERAVVDASLLRLVAASSRSRGHRGAPADGDSPLCSSPSTCAVCRSTECLADPPDDLDWDQLGRQLGRVLGRLSGMPFLRLAVSTGPTSRVEPTAGPSDLLEFAQGYRDTGGWRPGPTGLGGAGRPDRPGRRRPGRAGDRTNGARPQRLQPEEHPGATRSRHRTSSALVDWEFAHAGSVYTDFGNFSRFERETRLIEPLIEAFVDAAPGHVRTRRRCAARPTSGRWSSWPAAVPSNPVRELATELLLAQARAGDLQAWPFADDRVSPRA